MNNLPLYIVDAFTGTPFRGNPASVCLLERELPETTMQAIAAEMNHSETAFALPLDVSPSLATRFSLRWFTPEIEVPLCGPATLATTTVIFRELANPAHTIHFETKSGRLSARREDARIALDFPAEDFRPTTVAPEVCTALGAREVTAACYARKDRNLLLHLGSESEVRELSPDFTRLRSARGNSSFLVVIVTAGSGAMILCHDTSHRGLASTKIRSRALGNLTGKSEMRAYQASRRGGEMTVRSKGTMNIGILLKQLE